MRANNSYFRSVIAFVEYHIALPASVLTSTFWRPLWGFIYYIIVTCLIFKIERSWLHKLSRILYCKLFPFLYLKYHLLYISISTFVNYFHFLKYKLSSFFVYHHNFFFVNYRHFYFWYYDLFSNLWIVTNVLL